ncbi:dihydrofolate reductase family protein [Naasia lichenicola]|uniref:Deaminase n=1 Tax=Naasia lichenicola TaxID=2565933 RepID=A0A4S4FJ85_9MICO|nr:dihydrofolate reductase family protein [Naasia lichenicola]THG29275.1 deaminase [Naasia lichenicola]
MGRLIYASIVSLDGYVADAAGRFDWSEPDDEVHRFVNEIQRPIGTHLYGRRLYDVLVAWETWDVTREPEVIRDYAEIWRGADKVVYSRTLQEPKSARTRIVEEFDVTAVVELKATSATDILIGGPEIAALALAAGIVDEIHLLVSPVVVGAGNPAFPDDLALSLELTAEHRFGNGVVHLQYSVLESHDS